MREKKYRISYITLGCRANQYETDAIRAALEKSGFETAVGDGAAEITIINTCTVTGESDRKSRQMIRRAGKKSRYVIVTGCFAEVSPEAASRIEGVCAVIGNKRKSEIVRYVTEIHERREAMHQIPCGEDFEDCDALSGGTGERARAYIKIEDGCDNRCSYCIIPKARGPVRSKAPEKVVEEARALAEAGVCEIILTGIETASYGKDFGEDYSLIDLLSDVSRVDGIERIRMGSLDPSAMRRDFASRIAALPKVMPHFHLSLQSGCSRTLRAMRRKYNADQAAEFIENVRRHIPDAMLSADIIAGFPGESDEDFIESVDFLAKARLLHIHAFPYSPRPGTEAAEMDGQVAEDVKKNRLAQLLRVDRSVRDEMLEEYVRIHRDEPVSVLCETWKDGIARGHSQHFVEVEYKADTDQVGRISLVCLSDSAEGVCFGTQVDY